MSIVLNNESCLDFLPRVSEKSVNLVLIDPPYTISRATGFESCGEKGVERFKMSYEFGEWDNEIFVLDKGRVVENGTHAQLLSSPNSFYAKLWNTQHKAHNNKMIKQHKQ